MDQRECVYLLGEASKKIISTEKKVKELEDQVRSLAEINKDSAATIERLSREIKFITHWHISDDGIAFLTKEAEKLFDAPEHPPAQRILDILDDTLKNLHQVLQQRDKARADLAGKELIELVCK